MNEVTVKVDSSGRLVIPKEMRESLGIPDGGTLTLSVEDGVLQAQTRLSAIRRLQKLVAASVPPGVSLVDDLIAWRREEAARWEADMEAHGRAHRTQPAEHDEG